MTPRLGVLLLAACGGGASKPAPVTTPVATPRKILADPDDSSDPVAIKLLSDDRHQLPCTLEYVTSTKDKTFHGITPWSKPHPMGSSASCCALPSKSILCFVTEDTWTGDDGIEVGIRFHYAVEHALLFDPGGRAPRRDAIVAVFFPGPMNNPVGRAHPLVSSRLEIDATGFRVIPMEDTACTKSACEYNEPAECEAYHKVIDPFVRRFCADRGGKK